MSGKPRCPEIADGQARRGPDGKGKAGGLEPQCPLGKGLGLDTAIAIPGCRRKDPGRVAPGRTRSQEANPPGAGSRARTRHRNHPERQRRAERGMPYRATAPRQRRLQSSPRAGKPPTGPDAQAKGDRWVGEQGVGVRALRHAATTLAIPRQRGAEGGSLGCPATSRVHPDGTTDPSQDRTHGRAVCGESRKHGCASRKGWCVPQESVLPG
jgi:hypothetical protein